MQTEKHYGVLVGIGKGMSPSLAIDSKGAPKLFTRKHRAMCFKDELADYPHAVKGRVIPVTVSYELSN